MADERRDMKMRIDEIVMHISKMLAWILSIIAIYWLLLKLTGHSPTTDQLSLMVQGITLTVLIKHVIKTEKHMTATEKHMNECDRRFYALARDFRRHAEHIR